MAHGDRTRVLRYPPPTQGPTARSSNTDLLARKAGCTTLNPGLVLRASHALPSAKFHSSQRFTDGKFLCFPMVRHVSRQGGRLTCGRRSA